MGVARAQELERDTAILKRIDFALLLAFRGFLEQRRLTCTREVGAFDFGEPARFLGSSLIGARRTARSAVLGRVSIGSRRDCVARREQQAQRP